MVSELTGDAVFAIVCGMTRSGNVRIFDLECVIKFAERSSNGSFTNRFSMLSQALGSRAGSFR